jgi:peptide/nickel transport system permease protein
VLNEEEIVELAEEEHPELRPVAVAGARPRFGVFFWVCSTWLALLGIVEILAPYLHLQKPDFAIYLSNEAIPGGGINYGPSLAHWLGTDGAARDIFSRLIFGGRLSLVIALGATAIGITIGGALGMLSAYKRGRFDSVLSLVMYTGLAFPAIVAVLAILSFWGRTESHIIFVLGAFSIPLIYRLIRAATLSVATKEYITAARAQGATSWRVLTRDILPNVLPTIIAYTVFNIGGVIAVEGALGVLGVGIQPPTASWGNLIADAGNDSSNVGLVFGPTLVVFFTLLSLYWVGERLRLRFEVAEAKL